MALSHSLPGAKYLLLTLEVIHLCKGLQDYFVKEMKNLQPFLSTNGHILQSPPSDAGLLSASLEGDLQCLCWGSANTWMLSFKQWASVNFEVRRDHWDFLDDTLHAGLSKLISIWVSFTSVNKHPWICYFQRWRNHLQLRQPLPPPIVVKMWTLPLISLASLSIYEVLLKLHLLDLRPLHYSIYFPCDNTNCLNQFTFHDSRG